MGDLFLLHLYLSIEVIRSRNINKDINLSSDKMSFGRKLKVGSIVEKDLPEDVTFELKPV